MGDFDTDDLVPSVPKLMIPLMVIPTTAVGLRFWSRAVNLTSSNTTISRFWWDDWFALMCLILSLSSAAVILRWTTVGLGKHTTEVPPKDIRSFLVLLYVSDFLYYFGISLSKLSALCFYARIFNIDRKFRFALWTIAGLVVAWLLYAILSSTLGCVPIAKAWDPTIPGHCLNIYPWWLGCVISSVIIDFFILILPLPLLWNLHLTFLRKLIVSFVFVCGYAVIVVSIGHLVAVKRVERSLEKDYLYNTAIVGYWLAAETPVSIISICLPSIFSLIKRGFQNGPYSLFSSRNISSKPSATNHSVVENIDDTAARRDRGRGFTPLPELSFENFESPITGLCFDDGKSTKYHATTTIIGATPSKEEEDLAKCFNKTIYYPAPNSIHVQNDVEVSF